MVLYYYIIYVYVLHSIEPLHFSRASYSEVSCWQRLQHFLPRLGGGGNILLEFSEFIFYSPDFSALNKDKLDKQ